MEKVPLYLQWFFFRIKRHSGEKDYFVKRFDKMEREKMMIEVMMVKDLFKRGLILLSDKEVEKVFDPLVYSPRPGVTVHRAGTEHRVKYPSMFFITPAGKYLMAESALGLAGTVGWTCAAAFLGGLVGNVVR